VSTNNERARLEAEAAGMGGGSTGDSDAGNSEQSSLTSPQQQIEIILE